MYRAVRSPVSMPGIWRGGGGNWTLNYCSGTQNFMLLVGLIRILFIEFWLIGYELVFSKLFNKSFFLPYNKG